MKGDYAQDGDPYGIQSEYSSQSAATQETSKATTKLEGSDERGCTVFTPRDIPTQAEVDALMRKRCEKC
jgi:hypothetical protein